MPRKKRIREPNLTYHTISRCIENRDMIDDNFKEIMIIIIKKAQEKYDFQCIHYAILDNHFHFIIRTVKNGSDISKIMQYIKARFAETYNRIMHRSGTFWSERFKDVIIERQHNPKRYCLWLMLHIGYNPVRKYNISSPESYKYSAIRCYLEEEYATDVRITLHELFLQLGDCFNARVRKFRELETVYRKKYSFPIKVPYT